MKNTTPSLMTLSFAPFVRLRSESVRQLIEEQHLKKWWVAEFTGVHKTTLRRWLSGKIDRVRIENVEALARLLTVNRSAISEPI